VDLASTRQCRRCNRWSPFFLFVPRSARRGRGGRDPSHTHLPPRLCACCPRTTHARALVWALARACVLARTRTRTRTHTNMHARAICSSPCRGERASAAWKPGGGRNTFHRARKDSLNKQAAKDRPLHSVPKRRDMGLCFNMSVICFSLNMPVSKPLTRNKQSPACAIWPTVE
jgi:hypothetical protein